MQVDKKRAIDAISLEVIRNRLTAIADEMAVALQRTAYSTNIKTRRDYSCAIFDSKVRMISQSFGQPAHLGSLSHFVPRIIAEFGRGNLHPGDGILCNDGYRGGVHLNDICLVAPVFFDGEIIAFMANIAHHLDVGGATPGSMAGYATEIIQEGLRISPIKLVSRGAIDDHIFNFLMNNIRSGHETAGDLRAQIGGVSVGERRFLEAIGKFGKDQLTKSMSHILDYTELRVREEVKKMPRGIFSAEDFMDGDGNDPTPARVKVTIEISDEGIRFDLSGSSAQRRGPINATYAMSLSCCAYVLKALLPADVPANDGLYRVMKVVAPEGTLTNAVFPAPIGGGWETANRITETSLLALSQALPERVCAASKGSFCNIAFGGIEAGRDKYFMFYETLCGGYGARATKDGIDGVQAHGQNTENSPIEETEARYPVEILQYSLIPNSEGAGRFRGGLGVRRDYRFKCDVTFSVLADREKSAPWGLLGGGSAENFSLVLNPEKENRQLGSKVSIRLHATDTVSVRSAGGGGYGDPKARSPDSVARDVRAGVISLDRARTTYGIFLKPQSILADTPDAIPSEPMLLCADHIAAETS